MNVGWPYVNTLLHYVHSCFTVNYGWLVVTRLLNRSHYSVVERPKVFKTFQASSHSSYQSSTCVGSLTCITGQHLPNDSHQLRNNANDQAEILGKFHH